MGVIGEAVRAPEDRILIEGDDETGIVEFAERWTIECTPVDTTKMQVIEAPRLPRFRDSHLENSNLRVTRVEPNQIGLTLWEAWVTWRNVTTEFVQGANPILEPARVEYDFFEWEAEVDFDADGNPIATVIGEPMGTDRRIISDLVILITKNVSGYNPVAWGEVKDHVNADPWIGFAPGQALLRHVRGVSAYWNGIGYFERTAVIHVRIDPRLPQRPDLTWYDIRVHQGDYCKVNNGSGGFIYDFCRDSLGNPRTKLLTADGYELPDGQQPNYRYFKRFHSTSFNALQLFGPNHSTIPLYGF